jgi:regulator of replication initiation timing
MMLNLMKMEMKYDWNVMALEEMVDGMKYMMKENEKLRKNNQWLEKKLRDERYQRMVLEKGLDRG